MTVLATLDDVPFPFNPNSVTWGYQMNTSSTDTLGGRVTQLLSVKITSMAWEAEAGTRDALLGLYDHVYDIMLKHAATERPVMLAVPSRQWAFSVYVTSMPAVGWDLVTVSYKYRLTLEVDEDFGGIVTSNILAAQLARLGEGIGYDPNWHGGTSGETVVDTGNSYQGPAPKTETTRSGLPGRGT